MWINKDELPVSDSLFIQHGWWWSLLLQWVFRKQNSVGFPDGVCGKAQGWAPGGTAPFSPFSHAALHEGCSRGRECLRAALSCGLWALHQAILQTRDGPSFPLPAKLSLSSWRVSAQPRWRGGGWWCSEHPLCWPLCREQLLDIPQETSIMQSRPQADPSVEPMENPAACPFHGGARWRSFLRHFCVPAKPHSPATNSDTKGFCTTDPGDIIEEIQVQGS